MYITQISVYLENNHGTLRTLTRTLADAGIDMLGMSIADTTNFGIARIVVREADFSGAIAALIDAGFMARKNQVLCAAVPNKPAGLDSVLAVIEEKGIFIEYMYSFNYNLDGNALMILRLSSETMSDDCIAAALNDGGVKLVSQVEVNAL
ncbi:MAG: acetolactate synthase [Clostridia bacterium]|nr:acetolactate synthase [Clostridia bacterium]